MCPGGLYLSGDPPRGVPSPSPIKQNPTLIDEMFHTRSAEDVFEVRVDTVRVDRVKRGLDYVRPR